MRKKLNQTDPQPFGRIFRRYRLMNSVMSLGLDRRWRREALESMKLKSGQILLDIGCGTGDMMSEAGDKCGLKAGVDPELAMMREFVRSERNSPICGFAEALPIRDNVIRSLSSVFAVRNFANRMLGFEEMFRVLQHGGRGVVLEFSPPVRNLGSMFVRAYIRWMIPLLGWLIAGDRKAYVYLARTIMSFPQPEEIVQELKRAGFRQVAWRRLAGGVTILYCFVKSNDS